MMTAFTRLNYDKVRRCPGWSGPGWIGPKNDERCPGAMLWYDAPKNWQWRFHACPECQIVTIPFVTRWLDYTWWDFIFRCRIPWAIGNWKTRRYIRARKRARAKERAATVD